MNVLGFQAWLIVAAAVERDCGVWSDAGDAAFLASQGVLVRRIPFRRGMRSSHSPGETMISSNLQLYLFICLFIFFVLFWLGKRQTWKIDGSGQRFRKEYNERGPDQLWHVSQQSPGKQSHFFRLKKKIEWVDVAFLLPTCLWFPLLYFVVWFSELLTWSIGIFFFPFVGPSCVLSGVPIVITFYIELLHFVDCKTLVIFGLMIFGHAIRLGLSNLLLSRWKSSAKL